MMNPIHSFLRKPDLEGKKISKAITPYTKKHRPETPTTSEKIRFNRRLRKVKESSPEGDDMNIIVTCPDCGHAMIANQQKNYQPNFVTKKEKKCGKCGKMLEIDISITTKVKKEQPAADSKQP